MFALADGLLGVRGAPEERRSHSAGAYIANVFEQTAIHYHERLPGFASSTDTRVPVADGVRFAITAEGTPFDAAHNVERMLDLETGMAVRSARIATSTGSTIAIRIERVMPGKPGATIAARLTITSTDYEGSLSIASLLDTSQESADEGDDPRIGAELSGGGLDVVAHALGEDASGCVQRTRRSKRWVASAQAHRTGPNVTRNGSALAGASPVDRFEARLIPGTRLIIEKHVAYRWGDGPEPEELLQDLRDQVASLAALGFDHHAAVREKALVLQWSEIDIIIDGDEAADRALRFNQFHLHQSASRDVAAGTAAKGLTGEGYEGHTFWDSEAFLVPCLTFSDPALARTALQSRVAKLDLARANARTLNHRRGALYPWRTIAGAECSAHYPSGSAQYHINAAIAQALQLYVTATGDDDFLREGGAEMLWETARIWLEVGSYSARFGGSFCIFGVTGPDEYTALVDNNFYTNRMAALHLLYAERVAVEMARDSPEIFARISEALDLDVAEIAAWRDAAAAMYLPRDEALGIDAQDDSFLAKPLWTRDGMAASTAPLLLECHPLTLYRHQISKQADLILAMAFAGEDVPVERLRRNFLYYEAVTTHDSTLSACAFAIVAARAGLVDKALDFFGKAVLVDMEDLHGNVAHGSHMASLAGSVMTILWGFAGLAWRDGILSFSPVLPADWTSLSFAIPWRGRRIAVSLTASQVVYQLRSGEPLEIRHDGAPLLIGHAPVTRLSSPAPGIAA